MNKGILYAIGTYTLWGFLPIYLKAIQTVPALEILGHRIAWSAVFVGLLLVLKWDGGWIKLTLKDRKVFLSYLLASGLLAVNWLTYIYGVNSGVIVETSLGYFINPLVNVSLGVVLFREKLRPLQWVPIGLAFIGVMYLTISYGKLPWIALTLAFTFAFYGVLKKRGGLNALRGLSLETGVLFIPAVGYLLWIESQGTGAFGHQSIFVTVMLALAGVVTTVPLLMFASAAKRIHFSTLGLMQYIAPTFQFLIGVLIYNEPFTQARMVGFSLIWLALAIYTIEGFIVRRRGALPVMARVD